MSALPLKWLTDNPVWANSWPLPIDKSLTFEQLMQEQLDTHHIEESTIQSLEFSCIFC